MKQQKCAIDLVKFLLAIFLVAAHFGNEWGKLPTIIDYTLSLYIIVVPFFFVCSGYFLWRSIIKADSPGIVYKKYIIRILKLYLSWSVIYLVFKILAWIKNGVGDGEILRYIHHSLVHSTYSTIWFLPACALGALMIWGLTKKLSIKTVSIVAIVLYIIGCLGYSYDFIWTRLGLGGVNDLIASYKSVFVTTRNGVFNGFPWMWLGVLLAQRESKNKLNRRSVSVIGCIASLALVVAEAFIIKRIGAVDVNTTFLVIPFTWFFVELLIGLDIFVPHNKWMRQMSTLIFVSQRIFLTAIPTLFPSFMENVCSNSYVGLIYVLGCTLGFSALVLLGSKKSSALRYLV